MDRAREIMDAFEQGQLIAPDPELGEDEGYAIAEEIFALRQARGERPAGRKIGFTNRSLWREYNVDGPFWAPVYDTTVTDAAELDVSAMLQPRLEPEVQLCFRSSPPVTRDEEAILACVDWIALGFEIVQCPYPGWRFSAGDVIAAYGVHGALVVGERVPASEVGVQALRDFEVALLRDGEPVASGTGAAALGSPLLAVGFLLEVLARQGRSPLQAGEVTTTGTLTPPQPAVPGEVWSTVPSGISLPGTTLTLTMPRSPGTNVIG